MSNGQFYDSALADDEHKRSLPMWVIIIFYLSCNVTYKSLMSQMVQLFYQQCDNLNAKVWQINDRRPTERTAVTSVKRFTPFALLFSFDLDTFWSSAYMTFHSDALIYLEIRRLGSKKKMTIIINSMRSMVVYGSSKTWYTVWQKLKSNITRRT